MLTFIPAEQRQVVLFDGKLLEEVYQAQSLLQVVRTIKRLRTGLRFLVCCPVFGDGENYLCTY